MATAQYHDPSPRVPDDDGPFAGAAIERLTPHQVFARARWERARLAGIRDGVRAYAARLLAERGVIAANEELEGYGISIDSQGVVRFEGDFERDLLFRDVVQGAYDEVGEALILELPDHVSINLATGMVVVDDIEP